MRVVALGVSHKTASLSIRGIIAWQPMQTAALLQSAQQQLPGVREIVLVNTCNRCECYAIVDEVSALVQWWARTFELPEDWLDHYGYCYQSEQAVSHLMSVASGLESQVLGEPEILGQIKKAYQVAKTAKTCGKYLDRLFQYAFSVSKSIRTQTSIGEKPVSVAFSAVQLIKAHWQKPWPETKVLLLGAGQTMRLCAQYCHLWPVSELRVVNRTLKKAEQLAHKYGGHAYPLSELAQQVQSADIIFTATSAMIPCISREMVEAASQYKDKQMMIDLAVPRDIDARVSELPHVTLYTVDDVNHLILDGQAGRQAAVQKAQIFVQTKTQAYWAWFQAQSDMAIIAQFRHQVFCESGKTAEQAKRLLAHHSPEVVIEWLARTLTKRQLHAPTCALREALLKHDTLSIHTLTSAMDLIQYDTAESEH